MFTRVMRGFLRVTHWHVYELVLGGEIHHPEPLMAVTWRDGTAADVDSFTVGEHNYDAVRKKWAQEALSNGDRLLIAESDDSIAHLAWTTKRQITVAGTTLPLPPGSEYIYDARTPDRFRGKRLQNAEIRKIAIRAHAEGITRLLALVDDDVTTSMRNFEREGFGRIGTITSFRFLRRLSYAAVPDHLRKKITG